MPGHGPLKQPRDVVEFRSLIGDFYKVVEEVYKSGGAESVSGQRTHVDRQAAFLGCSCPRRQADT